MILLTIIVSDTTHNNIGTGGEHTDLAPPAKEVTPVEQKPRVQGDHYMFLFFVFFLSLLPPPPCLVWWHNTLAHVAILLTSSSSSIIYE